MKRLFSRTRKTTIEAKNRSLMIFSIVVSGLLVVVSVWAVNKVWFLAEMNRTTQAQLASTADALRVISGINQIGKTYSIEDKLEAMALDSSLAQISAPQETGERRQSTATAYMDGRFARVQVTWEQQDSSGSFVKSDRVDTYIFKKISEEGAIDVKWALVGINPVSSEQIQDTKTRFGIPDKVFLTE